MASNRFSGSEGDDFKQAARVAVAIEGYRAGKLGLAHVAQILNLQTRIEAQQWLAARQVPLNPSDEAEP